MTVELEVERADDHLFIRWRSQRGGGKARFDRIPESVPEWLGSADELLDGATRRDEGQILEAVTAWARDAGIVVGIWHDDAGVEVLD